MDGNITVIVFIYSLANILMIDSIPLDAQRLLIAWLNFHPLTQGKLISRPKRYHGFINRFIIEKQQ